MNSAAALMTSHNTAGPAGGGKFGLVDEVWMAAKVGRAAKMLRTHPPSWARAGPDGYDAAVAALNFSGTVALTLSLTHTLTLTVTLPLPPHMTLTLILTLTLKAPTH
jgi:hypothetical protein